MPEVSCGLLDHPDQVGFDLQITDLGVDPPGQALAGRDHLGQGVAGGSLSLDPAEGAGRRHDRSPGACERESVRPPDAGAGSGHDGHLAFQVHGASSML